jgi:serine/threonine protein kinase
VSDGGNEFDPVDLERYFLGRLPDDAHTRVERMLSAYPDASKLLASPPAEDALMRTLRQVGDLDETPLCPRLRALMNRVERQAPGQLSSAGRILSTTPPSEGGSSVLAGPWFLGPPEAADELGRLGNFRVLRQLGKGGMGLVFLAEDLALRRRVALKVMRPDAVLGTEARERFLREARSAAALDHEHVVPIFQVGEARGVPFLAMPLLAGESLEDRLRREGVLPLAEVLRIGRETAEGLAAAHAAGLIHRDIKPSNLWLQERSGMVGAVPPPVKILDFGLARPVEADGRLTQSGVVVGTPAYMAPEQANGDAVDARSDLFSLGCVLYHMTTGEPPFRGNRALAVMRAVAEHDPPSPHLVRPEVPPALSELIRQLLSKTPEGRPSSAQAVADALKAFGRVPAEVSTGTEASQVQRPLPSRPPSPSGARRRWLLGAGALGLLGLAVLVWRLGQERPGPAAKPPAAPPKDKKDAVVYRANFDMKIHKRVGQQMVTLSLADKGALPLRVGDQYHLEIEVQPPAYLYLFWIDAEARIRPAYPWAVGEWGSRPDREEARDWLRLPPAKAYTVTENRAGTEGFLMLARSRPFADDAEIQRLVNSLPSQVQRLGPREGIWLEGEPGGAMTPTPEAPPQQRLYPEVAEIAHPVLRTQDLLRNRLRPRASLMKTLNFTREGK